MASKELVPRKRKNGGTEALQPLEELRGFAESMERAFEDMWAPMPFRGFFERPMAGLRSPGAQVGMEETPKEFIVTVPLPGMDKKDIELDVSGDTVTVHAERREEKKAKGRQEQAYSSFTRSFTLPAEVKADETKASYKDGMLRIELPKARESQVHKVEIG